MTRIVLVGAGSVEFTRNLLGDILLVPGAAGRGARAPRHRPGAAADRGADGGVDGQRPRRDARDRASLDRLEALTGADFVINTIQVGGARATQIDFDIPARYGLQYTINDTINVGGVMRGLRTMPVVLGIVGGHGGRVPRRAVPQLHEPDGDARPGGRRARAGSRPSGCATRCTGPSTRWRGTWACRAAEVDARLGRRQPPRLDPAARAPRPRPVPGPARVRRRRHGPRRRPRARRALPPVRLLPTESSEHHAEYNPWFIPKGTWWSRSTSRSASTSPGRRTTSTSTPTPSRGSMPASRSRSSGAASTPR